MLCFLLLLFILSVVKSMCKYKFVISPLRGDPLLAVCHSVRLSVHSVSVHLVFRTFLSRPLRYWLEIWYVNLSWHNTDQVPISSRLTYLYRSYCPLLKFSFPGFSLPSFEILTLNLLYEFVLTQYISSATLVTPDLLLKELFPFAKIYSFPNFYLLSFKILA